MRKKGHTLAEVLITLTIIGVVAAIGAPMLNKAKPDRTRILFLKAYDSLTESVSNIVNTPTLFNQLYEVSLANGTKRMYNLNSYPLLDYNRPLTEKYNNESFEGENKFCNLLSESMNSVIVHACGTNGTFDNAFNFSTSPLNMQWHVVPPNDNLTGGLSSGTIDFAYTVTVDINGNRGKNSLEGTLKAPPDRYVFFVFANGKVEPASAIGQAYINQRLITQKSAVNLQHMTFDGLAEYEDRNLNSFITLDSKNNAPHNCRLTVSGQENADIRVMN